MDLAKRAAPSSLTSPRKMSFRSCCWSPVKNFPTCWGTISQLFETFWRRGSLQPKQMSSFCSGLRLSWNFLTSVSGFSSRQVEAQTGALETAAAAAAPAAVRMKSRRDTPSTLLGTGPSPQSGQILPGLIDFLLGTGSCVLFPASGLGDIDPRMDVGRAAEIPGHRRSLELPAVPDLIAAQIAVL